MAGNHNPCDVSIAFAVARLASECSGMALCMMLFFIVNPIYSAILGYRCGKDIKKMWNLPLVSAVAFLAGTWIFFNIHELWFIVYATVYLAIGWTAMAISKHINSSNKGNDIFPAFQTLQIRLFSYAVIFWMVEKKYYLFLTMRMTEHGNSFVVKNITKAMQG